MGKQEIKSEKTRLNRFMSSRQVQPRQKSPDDAKTITKRRVSCGQTITVKKTNNISPKRRKASYLQTKAHYKVSTDVISFEMEEQRSNQMKTILQDKQLQSYYLAFKKIFVILYQASHLIHEKIMNLETQLFENKSIVFLCLMFQQPKDKWTASLLRQFIPLAKNVIYLSNNPNQFERRIDLVARKVTLQNDKSQKIKNAFLNPKIQRAWEQAVEDRLYDQEIQTFVEDQFDTPQEKLCFIEIKGFILNKLSTKTFGDQLRKYCVLQQIDDDLSLDFKFEFLLAEEFSFTLHPCLIKEYLKPVPVKNQTRQQTNCSIM